MTKQIERPDIIEKMILQGEFERKTSSTENDEYRRVIFEEQLPRLKGKSSTSVHKFKDVEEATAHVKQFALQNGADRVAVCRINQEWVYRGVHVPYIYGIVLLKEMDFNKIQEAPKSAAGIETTRVYMVLGETTVRVGEHLRKLGYEAVIHHPRGDRYSRCDMLYVPHAISAGLGEHGRHGMLINFDFGPRVRIGMVSTDLELVVDGPQEKGIERFCEYCMKCRISCPPEAIPLKKEKSGDVEKFSIRYDLCSPIFEKTDGCSICIRDCVFNQRTVQETNKIVSKIESWFEILKQNPQWPNLE